MPAELMESPAPPDSGVRIWRASLDSLSSADLTNLESLLNETEKTRAARFHFEKDRRHYTAARGLLRMLLGTTLETSPDSIQFLYDARGKPSVGRTRDGRRLGFNLSHSAGWAMFATAWDREVGIDMESTTRLASDDEHLAALAERVLSPREHEAWRALPTSSARHAAFLRAWTRKEACAKATGAGVFANFREIEVILDAADPKPLLGFADAGTIYDLAAPDGFAAALAVTTQPN